MCCNVFSIIIWKLDSSVQRFRTHSVLLDLVYVIFCVNVAVCKICVQHVLFQIKVDPSLQIDAKTNPYSRRVQLDKLRGRVVGGNLWQKRHLEEVYRRVYAHVPC